MFSRPTLSRTFGSDQDLKRHLYSSPAHSHDMSDPTIYGHGPAAVGPEVVGIGRGASHAYRPSAMSAMEPTAAKLRRVSTLAYNSASMDSRDSRSGVLPSRWLVLVTAPTIVTEDGHLDTMSASGPAGREANGTLMPLHNTLFQQLSAIAKEYAFPSTAGLCLYIHYNEKGLSFAPRITDDSWLVLWRRYLVPDDYSVSPQDLPIVGHVEFDIDATKAKWYEAWVRTHRRMTGVPGTVSTSISSHPEPWEDEQYQDPPDVLTAKQPAPKRLSLLDKRGASSLSIQAVTRKQSYESSSRTMVEPAPGPEILPTIEDQRFADASTQPPVPRDVNDRIRKWRDESAPASPANFLRGTETYGYVDLATVDFQYTPHHEPYPAAPTSDDLENDGEQEIQQELNLDEFTWSISSAGPPIDLSPPTTPRSSVIEEWTLEDPDLLSPSVIATSWGPPSPLDLPDSPVGSVLYSPDLAWRMVENAPWSATIRLMSPNPSRNTPVVDSGELQINDSASDLVPEEVRPFVWPYCEVPSLAAGWSKWAMERVHLYADEQRPPAVSQAYGFFHLYHAVYPHIEPYPALACAGPIDPPAADSLYLSDNLSFGWPYMKATLLQDDSTAPKRSVLIPERKMSRSFAWPVSRDAFAQGWPYTYGPGKVSVALNIHYPAIPVYSPVYPHMEIYPAAPQRQTSPRSSYSHTHYPHFDIYPATASDNEQCPPFFVAASQYPLFDLYPAVFDESGFDVHVAVSYPFFRIYAPVYPHIVPYPEMQADMAIAPEEAVVSLWPCYPYSAQRVYSQGYPHNFDIYPEVTQYRVPTASSTAIAIEMRESRYPYLQIYAAQYPHFEIYPTINHVVRLVAEPPHLRVLIGPKIHSSTTIVHSHHHQHKVEAPHRHRHVRSKEDVPPVPPLPASVLAKYKKDGSPVTPPDVISSTEVRINGSGNEHSVVSQPSTIEGPGAHQPPQKRKWKHSHLDLHVRVFGVLPKDQQNSTTQTLGSYDTLLEDAPSRTGRPLSFQQPNRGRSGTLNGRPLSVAPMVSVGRLNMSKYPFA